jgi:broad specificity phosphatase PhoE
MTDESAETTTVHLLRHGEVDNPTGVLYGRLPGYRLSELGRRMAQRVADTVGDRDITHVVSSPLERAQETARPLAVARGLEVVTDPRAIESSNVFEGGRFSVRGSILSRPSAWPALWNPFRPSWGEPYKAVAARMMAAVRDARDAARGHEAVLVSHQLPIWVTRLDVEGRSFLHNPRRRQCTLCSLTSLVFDGDRLVTLRYSEPAADLIPVKDRNKSFSSGGRTPGPTPDAHEPTPPS